MKVIALVVLLAIPATYYIAPDSAAGMFLHAWYGVPVALLAGLAVFTVGGAAWALAGHPLLRRGP